MFSRPNAPAPLPSGSSVPGAVRRIEQRVPRSPRLDNAQRHARSQPPGVFFLFRSTPCAALSNCLCCVYCLSSTWQFIRRSQSPIFRTSSWSKTRSRCSRSTSRCVCLLLWISSRHLWYNRVQSEGTEPQPLVFSLQDKTNEKLSYTNQLASLQTQLDRCEEHVSRLEGQLSLIRSGATSKLVLLGQSRMCAARYSTHIHILDHSLLLFLYHN